MHLPSRDMTQLHMHSVTAVTCSSYAMKGSNKIHLYQVKAAGDEGVGVGQEEAVI